MRRLVLWDIDQTLVTVNGVSAGYFAPALLAVTGRELRQMPEMGGRTDRRLVAEVLTGAGVAVSEELLEKFYAAMAGLAEEGADEMSRKGHALPGALDAVAALAETPGVVQTVVTGNIEPLARLKLQLFGFLGGDAGYIDLAVGGFGSHSADRRDIVDLARAHAARKYGEFAAAEVVVIGDTVHDIAGAIESGVRAIGVATGRTKPDELAAAGAHVVLASLLDTGEVVRSVLNG